MTTVELVTAVKVHARGHYEEGGWDYIVECYTDEELAALLGRATTVRGAIWKVRTGAGIGVRDEVRRDVQATAF